MDVHKFVIYFLELMLACCLLCTIMGNVFIYQAYDLAMCLLMQFTMFSMAYGYLIFSLYYLIKNGVNLYE